MIITMDIFKKLPKIFAIAFILFISIFALDEIGHSVIGFTIHLIPTFVLIALTFLAMKKPKIGGIAFVITGIIFVFFFHTYKSAGGFILISGPLFLIGALFIGSTAKNIKEYIGRFVILLIIMVLIAFLGSIMSIGAGVSKYCKEAQNYHKGDCVQALITYIDSNEHDLSTKNKAVWALGQLGDERALPVLRKYYTGMPCDHERYLCQYELEKAIKWCETKNNLLGPLWRLFFL